MSEEGLNKFLLNLEGFERHESYGGDCMEDLSLISLEASQQGWLTKAWIIRNADQAQVWMWSKGE